MALSKKSPLTYIMLFIAGLMALTIVFRWLEQYYSVVGILKRTKVHLSFELILSLFLIITVYRLLRLKKVSDSMRKKAGDQKLVLSKRVEILLLVLMVNIIFNSLFFTYSPGRYSLTTFEFWLYIVNLLMQFLLTGNLVNSRDKQNKKLIKLDHRYSAVGAVLGLIAYATYFQMMT